MLRFGPLSSWSTKKPLPLASSANSNIAGHQRRNRGGGDWVEVGLLMAEQRSASILDEFASSGECGSPNLD
jgi:hypothetical protein